MSIKNFIWYEKYRPKELSELVLPITYRDKFESYIEEQNIPHLLFYGPQGSGKTSTAQIFINSIPCHSMSLNASSKDRGIDTIKGKVKEFASSQPIKGRLKIVFLDEADGLTADAQIALKNTIETYSKSCRFILTANVLDRIRREIRSRCTCYEFRQYPIKKVISNVSHILDNENVKAKESDVAKLVDKFYPDIRSIINNLQAGSTNGKFNPELIVATSIDMEDFLDNMKGGKVSSLRKMWAGMSDFTWVYKYIFDYILSNKEFEDKVKAESAEAVAEFMYRDASIADREINVTMCCMILMRINGWRIHFHI